MVYYPGSDKRQHQIADTLSELAGDELNAATPSALTAEPGYCAAHEHSARAAHRCRVRVRPDGCFVLSGRERRPACDPARLAAARLPVPVRPRRAARPPG